MRETIAGVPIPGPLGRTRAGPWILGALAVTALLLLFAVRPARRLWKVSDFPVYHSAARHVLDGEDLYDTDPGAMRYIYPPTLAVLLTPIARFPVQVAGILWLLAKLVALLWCMRTLSRLLPPATGPTTWVVPALGLLCVFTLVDNELRNGQADLWVLTALVVALAATVRNRPFSAGLAIAFGAALKVTPLLFGLWLLWRRSGRGLAGLAVGLVLFVLVVPAVVMGPEGAWHANQRFVEIMVTPYVEGGTHEAAQPRDVPGYSLRSAAYRWLEAPRTTGTGEDTGVHALHLDARTVEWIYRVLAMLLLGLTLWATHPPAPSSDPWACSREVALFATAMVLIAPLSRAAHFVVLLPAAVYVAAAWRRRGVRTQGAVLALATLLINVPLVFLPRATRVGVAGNGALLVGALLLGCALHASRVGRCPNAIDPP